METVPQKGCDLGVVVDPDVDRLALITEQGAMFGEEYTLVAAADYLLKQQKGPLVSNLSSSRALRDLADQRGVPYHASAVGEVNVVARMKEVDALIGGEGNGGVILPDLHYGRDALVGVALVLSHLAEGRQKLSALKAQYPAYYMAKNKAQLTPGLDVEALLARVARENSEADINTEDGVKIDYADSWVHLRKSNTEPIIRIYTEARTAAEAERLASQFTHQLEAAAR
jgi:phosphomannomutase